MSNSNYYPIQIERVTDANDFPALARMFDEAIKHTDTFHEMLTRYGPDSPYEGTVKALTESLGNPNHHIFKAVETRADEHGNTKEVIVGLSQWRVGYIKLPKVNPFADQTDEVIELVEPKQNLATPLLPTTSQGDGKSLMSQEIRDASGGHAIHEDARRRIWNAYISHIRGKKHVFLARIVVLPAHQKRGIASRLLQWGVDLADAERLVAYLNARPAAYRMYEKAGWTAVATIDFGFKDLEVAPVVAMLRKPRPERKRTA